MAFPQPSVPEPVPVANGPVRGGRGQEETAQQEGGGVKADDAV
jgi:hypothetical protein